MTVQRHKAEGRQSSISRDHYYRYHISDAIVGRHSQEDLVVGGVMIDCGNSSDDPLIDVLDRWLLFRENAQNDSL